MISTNSAAHSQKAFWDPKIKANSIMVMPGEHAISTESDLALATLLGSCVCACIRDVTTGVGGINHFLLPDEVADASSGSLRYGVNAMEVLVNGIIRQGGDRRRLEAKVFGGGNVISSSAVETVGDRNGQFVREYLRREGINIAGADLGGTVARRVYFFPSSGRAAVLRLEPAAARQVREAELELKARAKQQSATSGSVELF